LDEQIRKTEIYIAEKKIQERNLTVSLLLYGILLYLLGAAVGFFINQSYRNLRVLYASWILLYPLLYHCFDMHRLYSLLRLSSLYFHRILSYQATWLTKLKETQKLKVEELKKQTSYYQTRGLIERYDPEMDKAREAASSKAAKNENGGSSAPSLPVAAGC
jgi:hypothetical protein